jgi:PAS domain S-box-containing protein
MTVHWPWWECRLPQTKTMLGQIRTLYLGFLLIWPVFGLWSLGPDADSGPTLLAVSMTVLVEVWLVAGYRRQRFPAWSWIGEGVCISLVAGASAYSATVGLCFMWVSFRALYGSLREKFLAAAVLVGVMAAGVFVFHTRPDNTAPLLFTALISLGVNHVLARGSSARDRSADRESTLSFAGAGFVASTTRDEAMDVTLGAALGIDREVRAALIFTVAGPMLHVVAAAGRIGDGAPGWVTELAELPAEALAVMQPGGCAVLDGGSAEAAIRVLRLPPHPVVVLAPLAAYGHVFGMLVLALDSRPADDLSAAVMTLAGEAALTLDQLLSRSRLSIVFEHSPDALMLAGESGVIRVVNPAGAAMLGCPAGELLGRNIWSLLHPDDRDAVIGATPAQHVPTAEPCRIRGRDDSEWAEVEALVEYVGELDGSRSIVFTARDVSERQRLELELRHAQKLESVGLLAAGIAHEINTPIQFIGDNVRFLETAFADLGRLIAAYGESAIAAKPSGDLATALESVDAVATEIDIEFVLTEAPIAISQTLEGINRVANIVRAMKAFGHPGDEEKAPADLNAAITNTLVVANHEIKYVADVETDLGDLPLVYCHLGDINQVFLNLVVNAAHAIGSADRGRGMIRVTTRVEDAYAVIEVADTGTGVAPEIAGKLFDAFFTTKEVGAGTGQGLALVRTLVTTRHGGSIDFTTEVGVGTVFTIRLPVNRAERLPAGDELSEAAL